MASGPIASKLVFTSKSSTIKGFNSNNKGDIVDKINIEFFQYKIIKFQNML